MPAETIDARVGLDDPDKATLSTIIAEIVYPVFALIEIS